MQPSQFSNWIFNCLVQVARKLDEETTQAKQSRSRGPWKAAGSEWTAHDKIGLTFLFYHLSTKPMDAELTVKGFQGQLVAVLRYKKAYLKRKQEKRYNAMVGMWRAGGSHFIEQETICCRDYYTSGRRKDSSSFGGRRQFECKLMRVWSEGAFILCLSRPWTCRRTHSHQGKAQGTKKPFWLGGRWTTSGDVLPAKRGHLAHWCQTGHQCLPSHLTSLAYEALYAFFHPLIHSLAWQTFNIAPCSVLVEAPGRDRKEGQVIRKLTAQ